MRLENAVEIHIDNIVLLGNKSNLKIRSYDNNFLLKCDWCYFKQKPDELIHLYNKNYIDELDKEIYRKKITRINLKTNIYNQLDKIARKNIIIFLEKNINNISHFFKNSENGEYTLSLYDIGKDIANDSHFSVENVIKSFLEHFEYKDIDRGIIELSNKSGNETISFDMKQMKFENDDIDIFKKMYSLPILEKILAYEQYKRGIAPPFYNEVAKIKGFLEGKKTVLLLFKDGTEKHVNAKINDILATDYKKFWINTETKNMDISNLKSIRYGRKELEIDVENLKSIEKQLEEIISNNNNQNIKKEELEIES